jgi:hypothetical protein
MSAEMQAKKVSSIAEQLREFIGHEAEVRITDVAGKDPVAPGKRFTLHDVKLSPEHTHLICCLNEAQHISIPIYDQTSLYSVEQGVRLVSEDRLAELIYTLQITHA